MFTIYVVEGKYKFTHYGEALHFSRMIGKPIVIKRSWNPIHAVGKLINEIT